MSQTPSHAASLEFDLLDRLAKSLRVSGMKPGDMARALGVHRNTVGNYLNGRTPIDRRTLIAWAFACAPEVTPEWIETGVASSDPDPEGPVGGRDAALRRLAERKREGRHANGATCGYPIPMQAA